MNTIFDSSIRREDHKLFNEQIKNLVNNVQITTMHSIDENSSLDFLREIERIGYFVQLQLKYLALSVFLDDISFEESYGYAFKVVDYLKELNSSCYLKHEEFKSHPSYEEINRLLNGRNKKNNEANNDISKNKMGDDRAF